MEISISNDIKFFGPDEQILTWCENNLIITNPLWKKLKALGKDDLIRRKHVPEKTKLFIFKKGILEIPFGLLYSVWNIIKQNNYDYKFNNNEDISFKNEQPTYPMFDYQEQAIETMIKAKGGVLVSPCGSGKTYMGIELIRRLGKKTLWLCHTGDLLRQAKEDLLTQYPTAQIGLTTEGNVEIGQDVTISTIQTMSKIDPFVYREEFDMIICDECAHVAASPDDMKMFVSVISKIPARYKFGLTATPSRSDGLIKSMYCYIGVNQQGQFAPTYKVDKKEVKTITAVHERINLYSGYDNDFSLYDTSGMIIYNKLIEALSENNERTEKILQKVIECNKEHRKQIVLSHRIEHCKYMVERLQQLGVNAVLCIGEIKNKKRDQILKQEIKWDVLVATYALLKEGVSIKELDTLHLTTPVAASSENSSLIIQCVGRIERYLDNKNQPIVYDYVDVDIPYCEKKFTERRRALNRRF